MAVDRYAEASDAEILDESFQGGFNVVVAELLEVFTGADKVSYITGISG